MKDSRAICSYLEQFDDVFNNIMSNSSEIQLMIQQLITYHEQDPTYHFYNELKDNGKKGSAVFSKDSVLYLLERRRIVVYRGSLHLVVKSGVVPLTTVTGRRALSIEFSLNDSETGFLLNTLFMLNALCEYQNLTTGNVVYTVLPNNYNENYVRFNDALIDMHSLTIIEDNISIIPSLRLHTNFYDKQSTESIEKIKRFILFVADFDIDIYYRLLKILAYSYTHNVLEKMFVFLGKGRNGKGLFLRLIQTLCLGKVHTLSSMYKMRKSSTSSKESEILEILTSKATLVEEELDFTKPLFDECYKNLVTGGAETGRRLGNNAETLRNNSVFFVATNFSDFNDIKDDDFSFLDRVCFTDFNNKFIDKTVMPEDHVLISEIFDSGGEVLNFVNLIKLLFQEAENIDRPLYIPNMKSNYVRNGVLEDVEAKKQKVYDFLKDNQQMIEKKNRIQLNKLAANINWTTTEIKQAFMMEKDAKIKRRANYDYLQLTDELIKRKITMEMKPEDFSFHDYVDIDDLIEGARKQIRVTELMYECCLDDISKMDMTEYLECFPFFEVKVIQEQPFVQTITDYVPESEDVITVVEGKDESNINNSDFLASLITQATASESISNTNILDQLMKVEAPVSNNNDFLKQLISEDDSMNNYMSDLTVETIPEDDYYKVSVFDQNRYPISNIDYRTRYTSNIPALVSSPYASKEETVKLFPYDIETRGDISVPNKLLALDFDSATNGNNYQDILDTFDKLNMECFVQESFSSMKKGYVKFHVIVYCNDIVYATRYKEITEKLVNLLPYELDENFRYRTIMNCSSHPWHHFKGEYFDTTGFPDKSIERETIKLSDGREIIQDKSSYDSVIDYLIDSGHESAGLFLKIIMEDYYGAGNRDDTVFKLTSFLNDSLEHYNMKPSVYQEGYEILSDIVFKHPVIEGKADLLRKIEKSRIDVS